MPHRILIVEDEPVVLNFARAALISSGHDVLAAHSVAEAHALLTTEVPGDELCLLVDVVLERESGIAFAQEVIRREPQHRVLLMSGFTDDVLLGEPGLDDRIGFIRKPFTRAELIAAIDAMCAA